MGDQTRLAVGIVGAGASGLSAAWELARAGHQVEVFEAERTVGGLAAGFRDDGWEWFLEKFYHHWFATDHAILALARELGVRDQVMFRRARTSSLIDGRRYASEMNLSALRLPVSFGARLRQALVGAYLKYLTRDWHALEQFTADAWLRRHMGDEVYRTLWAPLLVAKFGDRYLDVNMAWVWARIVSRSLRLGTYRGGFQALLDHLAAALRQAGTSLRLSTPVTRIGVSNGRPVLEVHGEIRSFDRVISTVSPSLMLRLAPELRATDYGRQVSGLESCGAISVVLALRQSLLTDGTYWLNVPAASMDRRARPLPFLTVVEHTNWLDRRDFGGDVIVYCGDYVDPEDAWFKASDDDLMARLVLGLPNVNPGFERTWIRRAWIWRAPYAQPISRVGQSRRIPPLQTPLPAVYWGSMSQVYPWDRGTSHAVALGRQVAKMALGVIPSGSRTSD